MFQRNVLGVFQLIVDLLRDTLNFMYHAESCIAKISYNGHAIKLPFCGKIYHFSQRAFISSMERGVARYGDGAKSPKSFVGYVQIPSNNTHTKLSSTDFVGYSVYVMLIELSAKISSMGNRTLHTVVGILPVSKY